MRKNFKIISLCLLVVMAALSFVVFINISGNGMHMMDHGNCFGLDCGPASHMSSHVYPVSGYFVSLAVLVLSGFILFNFIKPQNIKLTPESPPPKISLV